MKIGILTLPLHTNYGGILQAYALQTVLRRMGHEVCLLEEEHNLRLPLWKSPFVYSKRIFKNILGHHMPIFYEKEINRKIHLETPIIQQYTDLFIRSNINRRIVKDFSEIRKSDYDAIVVGSDQIWRPKYFRNIQHAYLDFTKGWNIRRIAYAASFGTDEWEYSPKQTKQCAKLLKRFDLISVRELSAVSLCKDHFGLFAVNLVDPTMLLDKRDYIRLFETAGTPQSSGDLLCYVLDETPEKAAFIAKFAEENRLTPFRVNSMVEDSMAPLLERIQPPVEQWLRGFYDAKFVITDSFHACVFSILFNKPFYVFGNKGRGISRFVSLFNMFTMEDGSPVFQCDKIINGNIDWLNINIRVQDYRDQAIAFLKKI